jgi:hypothetical protein
MAKNKNHELLGNLIMCRAKSQREKEKIIYYFFKLSGVHIYCQNGIIFLSLRS